MRFIVALALGFFAVSASAMDAATLGIEIRGVRAETGKVHLALFESADGFPDDFTKAVKIVSVNAESGTMRLEIAGLPPGDYAFAYFNDANNNDELDRGAFGIPREDFGFSNDPRITRGPPTFNQSKFDVGMPRTNVITNFQHL